VFKRVGPVREPPLHIQSVYIDRTLSGCLQLLEAAGETAIIDALHFRGGRIPNEADGDAGAGFAICGDACCRLQQQCDQPHPHSIANTRTYACFNSIANPNSYAVPNSAPLAHTHSNSYADPFTRHSGLGGPIQRTFKRG